MTYEVYNLDTELLEKVGDLREGERLNFEYGDFADYRVYSINFIGSKLMVNVTEKRREQ